MRLIDADDLLMDNSWAFYDENGNRNNACIAVENAPTVDAVPVVRCKDCKKYIPCQKLPIGTSKWCDLFDRATCEMNYCAWGERKKMIDERHLNGTTGESKSYTVINNGNATSTTRNLYYEQLQEQSDRNYVEEKGDKKMSRLVDADKLMQMIPTEEYNARMVIANAPAVDAEPTEEQVKEYCRKRCLVLVTSELFNEMKARWSAEPVRRGHWIRKDYDIECSECHARIDERDLRWAIDTEAKYCLNCGCKMDEATDDT